MADIITFHLFNSFSPLPSMLTASSHQFRHYPWLAALIGHIVIKMGSHIPAKHSTTIWSHPDL